MCTGRVVLPVADYSFKWMYFAPVLLGIGQLKNVVCYRKDNPAGTQFLPSPCGMVEIHQPIHTTGLHIQKPYTSLGTSSMQILLLSAHAYILPENCK